MNKKLLTPYIQPLLQKFKNMPWEDQDFYEQYLAQTYYYTFHSTRMLALAAAFTSTSQENYYRRSLKHIAEEEGHEKIALNDLKRLGGNIEDHTELPTTKAFWQSQYYYIDKENTSLLGYILCLEWLAVDTFPDVYSKTLPLYSKASTNFIRVHAEEDPDHVDQCFEQIGALPKDDQYMVMQNFIQSCRMFTLFMEEVEHSVKSDKYSKIPDRKSQVASPLG